MEEKNNSFQAWFQKWDSHPCFSVLAVAASAGLLTTLLTRLLGVDTEDVSGNAVWRFLIFVAFFLVSIKLFTPIKRKDIAFSAGLTMAILLIPIILELSFPILSSSALWGYIQFLWQWPVSLSYPLNLAVKNPGLSRILSLFSLFFFVPFGKSSKAPQ